MRNRKIDIAMFSGYVSLGTFRCAWRRGGGGGAFNFFLRGPTPRRLFLLVSVLKDKIPQIRQTFQLHVYFLHNYWKLRGGRAKISISIRISRTAKSGHPNYSPAPHPSSRMWKRARGDEWTLRLHATDRSWYFFDTVLFQSLFNRCL